MTAELALDYGGPRDRPLTPWQRHELDLPVFERFSRMVECRPQHPAVVSSRRCWSYQQIHSLALAVAAELESATPEPVAILLPAGGRFAAACLGALALGRPYVPIDPAFPVERNRLILQQAGVRQIISDAGYTTELAQISTDVVVIDIDRLTTGQPGQRHGHSTSPAYILYTSGSTGQPKGVYQHQRGLLHDIYQYSLAIHLHHDDKLTWIYSPSVNGALRDLYGALLNGATLYALPVKELGLQALAQRIAQAGITIFHAIPPLLRAFLYSAPAPDLLASVRLAYISGDRLFSADVAAIFRYFPPAALIYNGIGSTECATLYRHWFITADTVLPGGLAPVGYAVAERMTRLRNEQGLEVAVGEVGEVEIGSEFIAQGYWRNPELTAHCFVADPEHSGRRWFQVGDLARQNEQGLWEYVGRKDGQLKIRGYRVEIGAVEAALRQLPAIRDVAVLVSEGQEPELVAFLVGEVRDQMLLRQQAAASLPPAALPARYYWLDAMPRLANFKTDLMALKHMAAAQPTLAADRLPDGENMLSAGHLQVWWNEALQRRGEVDPGRSFEDYGGDSLKALSLLVLLEQGLQRTIPVQVLHAEMTLDSLLQSLSVSTRTSHHVYLVAGQAGISQRALRLTRQLPECVQVHLPPPPDLDAELEQYRSIADLGRSMADRIVNDLPTQPIHMLGISFGARVVFEAACELQRRGIPVGSLTVVDMGPAYRQATLTKIWTAGVRKVGTHMVRGRLYAGLAFFVRAINNRLPRVLIRLAPRLVLRLLYRQMPENMRPDILQELGFRQVARWQPSRYAGQMTVVVAEDGISKAQHLPEDLGWQAYADSVAVLNIPGGHGNFADSRVLQDYLQQLLAD